MYLLQMYVFINRIAMFFDPSRICNVLLISENDIGRAKLRESN